MPRILGAALAVACALALVGCGGAGSDLSGTDASPGTPPVQPLPANIVVDYQLGGGYPPPAGIGGVVRDSTDEPADGLYSICYLNAFQTQPADRSLWLERHPELLLMDETGEPLIDENWPDELLFDISSAPHREELSSLLAPSIAECSDKGFAAIELDNLDSWTRSHGALTDADALAFASLLTETAHAAGLAVGQKNAPELGTRGRDDAGFDFAIAEQCHRYDECQAYTAVYGLRVLDIEYAGDLGGTVAEVCSDDRIPFSTIVRDLALATPGSPGYTFDNCR